MAQRLPAAGAWLLTAVLASAGAAWRQGDEPAPTLKASQILPAAALKGPHYAVGDRVEADGYLYAFTLTSDYGPFTALGRSELTRRVDEIRAIGALDDVSKTEVFLKSAGGAVVDVGKGAASAVVDPVGTAKGPGAGIKRFGVNLGRASKRALKTEGGAATGESAAEGAADTVLGVSSAMRHWAQKVGADPYTTNITLRKALKSIAEVDAAGSIAANVAIPIPRAVGTTATVGDLVWSKDPEELRKLNEQRLAGLGVSKRESDGFFKNGWYTLTLQTRFAAALDAVKAPGCADYVSTASGADSEREAHFFVESAEMLQRFHAAHPVERLLTDSRGAVAGAKGLAVLMAPLDFVRSTAESREALQEIGERSRKELGASRLEVLLTGHASSRMKAEAAGMGWTIRESQPAR